MAGNCVLLNVVCICLRPEVSTMFSSGDKIWAWPTIVTPEPFIFE